MRGKLLKDRAILKTEMQTATRIKTKSQILIKNPATNLITKTVRVVEEKAEAKEKMSLL